MMISEIKGGVELEDGGVIKVSMEWDEGLYLSVREKPPMPSGTLSTTART